MRKPNSKTFDKTKARLVATLEKAEKLTEKLAAIQMKGGSTYFNATANRWVGFELRTLIERSGALNE